MFVRNFFTKAVAEDTGCFAFFTGSVLGVEAFFRACFEWTNHFYLKEVKGLYAKPFMRVKIYRYNGNVHMWETEMYNAETGSYEQIELAEKDKAFLLHIIRTNSAVLSNAKSKWRKRIERTQF